jgi:pyruvate ferredoxin oxidoreductase delta subunit
MSGAKDPAKAGFTLDVSDFNDWDCSRFPKGACGVDAGNSVLYLTGGWRSERPIWDLDACKHCLLCWVHCPDSSIIVAEGRMAGIDYDHCKGCGVCAVECKFDALRMISESEALDGAPSATEGD